MKDDEKILDNLADNLSEKPPVQNVPQNNPKRNNAKRNRVVGYILLFFVIAALIAFVIWWEIFRNHESTDDAYVGGNMVIVSARQDGSAIAYYADDTDYVEMGRLLVELDPTDYLLNFEQKKITLELAARQVRDLFEDVQQKESEVRSRKATLNRSLLDYKNRHALVGSEAISKEDYQHSDADLNVAQALLDLATHQLEGARARLGTTSLPNHPLIEQAKNDAREAYLGLKRCSIFAPVSGFVAKRNVQAGQSIKSTTPLLAIIPLDDVWVDANFRETQLEDIRIGQPVEITADMYGSGVVFNGIVGGIQGGSGSVFSLLPPQNATGNWIKIVQRVPVRIFLDREQIKKHPLFLGISVFAKITVEDTSGPVLGTKTPAKAFMQTDVFDISFDELEPVLDGIVADNLGVVPETDNS